MKIFPIFQFTTSQGGRPGPWDSGGGSGSFQFTTSQGGRPFAISFSTQFIIFQFTTSQGGRPVEFRLIFRIAHFQFTTSQGGRLNFHFPSSNNPFFQFTTSQGGRLVRFAVRLFSRSFNSRPHKEVDSYFKPYSMTIALSIHDLTRRSTEDIMRYADTADLSIHDLTRRSTTTSLFLLILFTFQFTTSQGGRHSCCGGNGRRKSFNSRPHKEVDIIPLNELYVNRSFNSRPHKEVDVL